jgi:hypothetical protein
MSRSDRNPDSRTKDRSDEREHCFARDARDPIPDRAWNPARDLTLPHSPERQPVSLGRACYHLRDSETQLLALVGTFRVVPESEVRRRDDAEVASPTAARQAGDVRSLMDQGLLEARTVVINDRPERVLALTSQGKAFLEAHRGTADRPGAPQQAFHAGFVKPRELAHDAQLHRLFSTERDQIEREGGRVMRVVLDYEFKRDYHTCVHEQETAGIDARQARQAFAEEHALPFVRGHLELPDVRVEYETADGRLVHRDLELATEQYSRSQLAGKHSAGFRVYRAAGLHSAGDSSRGGSPQDPHYLEWLQ